MTQTADGRAIEGREENRTEYAVGVTPRTAPREEAVEEFAGTGPSKVAVLIAHGMGQQIPFETLDSIAQALRAYDRKMRGHTTGIPFSTSVKYDDKVRLPRIELQLKSDNNPVEAHVYEAYWAPLTEGKIDARGVIAFLAGGGSNGLKIARRHFRRWLFDEYHEFPTPFRSLLYLLIALATLVSLVVLNSTIAAIAAAKALFGQSQAWLTPQLFADLTTTFNVVVSVMAAFSVVLALAHLMRVWGLNQLVRRVWGWVTVPVFALSVTTIILAAVAVLLILYSHLRGVTAAEVWPRIFHGLHTNSFNLTVGTVLLVATAIVGAVFLLMWVGELAIGFWQDVGTPSQRWINVFLTIGLTISFVVVAALIVWLIVAFARLVWPTTGASAPSAGLDTLRRGAAWPLLIAFSALARFFIVQFVGDVAIYVMPYKLDAFNDLRKEIKETVYSVAHAVYSMTVSPSSKAHAYDKIILLGHSLGSVIAYDALNKLILEDKDAGATLRVAERTCLFLTFGSPLDKTAFIFGAQGHGTTEAREALAASVQPLIQGYQYRPAKWINIYSPWDIISGSLDLYDLPPEGANKNSKAVDNRSDPDATTLLMAHTEYWSNELLVKTLYAAL